MLSIYVLASPDGGLAWLIYALLAFLLIIIVVGALVGSKVFDGRAPGALRDAESTAPAHDEPSGGREARA